MTVNFIFYNSMAEEVVWLQDKSRIIWMYMCICWYGDEKFDANMKCVLK